jgi:hypothetical protein
MACSQSQSHFTADSQSVSQSVCLGVEPTLWTFDQILLPFQELGSGICCPVSVGPPLWREAGSVFCQSASLYGWQSVGQYVLVSSPLCGRLTRYCFLFKSLGLEFVVLPLWGALSDERPGLSFVIHSHFTADSQSVSMSWCRAHFVDVWPDIASFSRVWVWNFISIISFIINYSCVHIAKMEATCCTEIFVFSLWINLC